MGPSAGGAQTTSPDTPPRETAAPKQRAPENPLAAGLRESGFVGGVTDPNTARDREIFDFLIVEWNQDLEDLRRVLGENTDLSPDQLDMIRQEALQIEERAASRRAQFQQDVADVNALLRSVAPDPTRPDILEPQSLRTQRAQIEERLRAEQARVQQADLTIERARQILQRIGQYQQERVRERLLQRFPTPIVPSVAINAVTDLGTLAGRWIAEPFASIENSLDGDRWRASLPPLATAAGFGLLLLAAGFFWLRRRMGRGAHIDAPNFPHKLMAAVVTVVSVGLLPVIAIAGPVYMILERDLITGAPAELLLASAKTLCRFLFAFSLLHAAIAPRAPAWRLSDIPDDVAPAVFRRAVALLVILQLAVFVGQSANLLAATPPLLSMFVLVASVLFSINLFALLGVRWNIVRRREVETADTGASEADDGGPLWLDIGVLIRLILVAAAIATPVIAMLGYSRLSIFLMSRLLDAGLLIFALYLFRYLVQSVCEIAIIQTSRVNRFFRTGLDLNDGALDRIGFWTQIATDVLILLVLVLGLALIFGVTPAELQIAMTRALEGVQIGSISIAPGALLAAIISFVIALVVTRFLQRGLSRRIFPHTHIDTGVQHSVNAAIGYAGVAVALLVAVAVAGIDLSNIALIAGALSVGIGFGLQAIVNNFVSGLILLAERPVKVGDWIRIGDHEGSVKRINVRSTEIQTFRRTDVIIPNSDLISNAVVNFTHKDRLGRLEFPVPVGFDADPDRVAEILMQIAREHPNVVDWPAPHVLLKGFGSHTMLIELRVFLGDIWTYYFPVINDINLSIVRELRAAGIPFQAPYQDIHMLREDPQAANLVRVTPVGSDGQPLPSNGAVEAGGDGPER